MTSINPGLPNESFSQRCLDMLFLDPQQESSQGGMYKVMVVSIILRYNNLQILLCTMGSCYCGIGLFLVSCDKYTI